MRFARTKSFEYLRDRHEIEQFLRRDVHLHLYGLGDLDDFFWPYTTWYGLRAGGELQAVALSYTGQPLHTLLALRAESEAMEELLRSILHLLPARFYAHLSPGLEPVFAPTHRVMPRGNHYKMALREMTRLPGIDCSETIPLGSENLAELRRFYDESYPDNWFDPRMLKTGQYFGARHSGKLVSAGGIHVYSPQYGVAALGNVATHPLHRGKGLGTAVTARVCRSVGEHTNAIGLNVKTDNSGAIASYSRLGFEIVASYGEYLFETDQR